MVQETSAQLIPESPFKGSMFDYLNSQLHGANTGAPNPSTNVALLESPATSTLEITTTQQPEATTSLFEVPMFDFLKGSMQQAKLIKSSAGDQAAETKASTSQGLFTGTMFDTLNKNLTDKSPAVSRTVQQPAKLVAFERSIPKKKRTHKTMKRIGGIAFTGLLLFTSQGGFKSAPEDSVPRKRVVATVAAPPEQESTTTTIIPETTTTINPELMEPAIPYEGVVGEEVAEIVSPTICNLVSHVKKITVNELYAAGDGSGSSPIDAEIVIPLEQRQKVCEQVVEYANLKRASTDPDYQLRTERSHVANKKKQRYPVIDGVQMRAGDYEAIAGTPEGIGVSPGQIGNFVSIGHGSTHSATNANIGALKPGDKQYTVRGDGQIFEYEVIGHETIPTKGTEASAVDAIYNYKAGMDDPASGIYNNAYMTQYGCSDKDGDPGSNTHRLVVRSVMTGQLTIGGLQEKLDKEIFDQLTLIDDFALAS